MPQATFRFYGELNDFNPLSKKGCAFDYSFSAHRTVKDLIEGFGVPHGEVGLILINGESVDFSARVKERDRVSIYPVFESINIHSLSRVRPPDWRKVKFLLDVPLGRLASHLRLLGFDTLWKRDYQDEEAVRIAETQARILLTRDRQLLMRKEVTHGYFVREVLPRHQLVEVLKRFKLSGLITPFARCLRCNGLLLSVEKKVVEPLLEPKTKVYFHTFSRCEDCGRIYWKGSHYEKIQKFVDQTVREARSCAIF